MSLSPPTRFKNILEDLSLLAHLDSNSPYGFWLCHNESASIWINNAFAVGLGHVGLDTTLFRSAILGESQFEFCQRAIDLNGKGQVSTHLTYACERGILNFEAEIVRLSNYPDYYAVLHRSGPKSIWPEDSVNYPYLLKTSLKGTYEFYSSSYERDFFSSAGSRLGSDAILEVEESHRATCQTFVRTSLRHPDEIFDLRLRTSDPEAGGGRDTQWQFIALTDCWGKVESVYARGYDMSALFEESREQLKRLTEGVPGFLFQIDRNESGEINLSFLSKAFAQGNFGISEEDLNEDPSQIMKVVSPKDYSTLLGSIIYAARKQQELETEFRVVNALDEERWFRVKARPEVQADGSQFWYGMVHSIDDQKDSEKEQQKLARIAQSTSDLMLLINPNLQVDWMNIAAQRFLNQKLGRLEVIDPLNLFQSEESPSVIEDAIKALEERRSMELKLPLASSLGQRWVEMRIKPIWNANGEFLYSLVVMRDIHEEELKSQEMESLLNLTSEQNKRLQSFTYIVSHNIRSHSANLQGLLETIQHTQDPTEREELWSYLYKVSEGLDSTIKHLNEIIAINQSLNKAKVKVDLAKELDHVQNILRAEIQQKRADIEIKIEETPEILAVHAYLESILLNLLSNALRYAHPKRPPKVKIKTSIKSNYYRISIKDNGLGIDLKRHKNRIFQLYQTFHAHPESRGLGLYIMKNQIKAMGGEIEVRSTVDVGTEFRVFLPMANQK